MALEKLMGGGNSLLSKRINRCWKSACVVNGITGENKLKLFAEVVWNWFAYGASDEDFLTMEFYRKNRREKKRWLTSAKNNRYLYKTVYTAEAIQTFDHKEYFDKRFKHLMKHDFLICKESSAEEIRAFIEKYGEVIVKPAGGACGVGIFKLKHDDKTAVENVLAKIATGENLIMEQLIVQHPDMAKMNPSSVNTIRVITMVDRKGEVHIITTCAKFGGSEACISNTFGGGFCCHINQETGIIDAMGHDIHGGKVFRHPVSGFVIPGYQIPNWDGVIDYANKLAKVMPEGRYIGWDVVILEDGYDVIEGNLHPGQDFQACDGIGRWKQIKELI